MVRENKAGIVVLREQDSSFAILGLKFGATYDLPKGNIEPYESELDAALRETKEESGITELDFRWGLQKTQISNIVFFIATTTQSPSIQPNPKTGVLEHHMAIWLTLEQAETMLHTDLRPVISWVKQVVRTV